MSEWKMDWDEKNQILFVYRELGEYQESINPVPGVVIDINKEGKVRAFELFPDCFGWDEDESDKD